MDEPAALLQFKKPVFASLISGKQEDGERHQENSMPNRFRVALADQRLSQEYLL